MKLIKMPPMVFLPSNRVWRTDPGGMPHAIGEGVFMIEIMERMQARNVDQLLYCFCSFLIDQSR